MRTPILDLGQAVFFEYRNHRGVHSARHVAPVKVWFGVSPYHDGPQWFLQAFDLDKGSATRDFAMKDISHWGKL